MWKYVLDADVHVLVGRAALQTEFKSWAVMGFSIAHQSPPAIFFVCVAMEGGHTCKGSISSNVLCISIYMRILMGVLSNQPNISIALRITRVLQRLCKLSRN